jgi:hypothetical protein
MRERLWSSVVGGEKEKVGGGKESQVGSSGMEGRHAPKKFHRHPRLPPCALGVGRERRMKNCTCWRKNYIWGDQLEAFFDTSAPQIALGGGGHWGALVKMLRAIEKVQ